MCASSIAEIAIDFALGVAQAVLFVLSFGTSSEDAGAFAAAKQSVKDAFGKLSKSDQKTAAQQAEDAINKMTPEEMKNKMANAVANVVQQGITNEIVKEICDQVGDQLIGKLKNTNAKGLDFNINFQNFILSQLIPKANITQLTGVNCGDTDTSNGN